MGEVKSKRRFWTKTDVSILREKLNNKIDVKTISEELGRTEKSIRAKAFKEKIPITSNREFWTSEEVDHLKKLVGERKSLVEISSILGRSETSVYSKASKLEVKSKYRNNWTTETYGDEIYRVTKGEYEVIGNYTKYRKKIKKRHNNCGNVFYMSPNHFLRGVRCPFCNGTPLKTNETFLKEVEGIGDFDYDFKEPYKGAHTKIKVVHRTCGNTYKVTPHGFFAGNRCPRCSFSKGEDKIEKYLSDNNVRYKAEKTFEGLRVIRPLRYDFYLPDEVLLIEYDGEQHFRPYNGTTGAIKELDRIKKYDEIKNEYAKNNGIELLRIPYWDYGNIEEILESTIVDTTE